MKFFVFFFLGIPKNLGIVPNFFLLSPRSCPQLSPNHHPHSQVSISILPLRRSLKPKNGHQRQGGSAPQAPVSLENRFPSCDDVTKLKMGTSFWGAVKKSEIDRPKMTIFEKI